VIAYYLGNMVFLLVGAAFLAAVVAGIVFLAKSAANPTGGADWYPDPENPELLRYFDGEDWTEDTEPRVDPPDA